MFTSQGLTVCKLEILAVDGDKIINGIRSDTGPACNFSMDGLYINVWTNISGMCLYYANHQFFTHGFQGGFQSRQ
ncbi:MAG: hypothetical protein R3330_12095, partial [Saprospiraceae bacterium]|nr:hypothetical protein [Saprospiraceae bacterium]